MDPAIQSYLLTILALSVVFGLAAQFSRFCLVGGLSSMQTARDGRRFAVYIGAIGVAILATLAVQAWTGVDLNQTKPPYRTPDFAWGRYILGGLIFGSGMVLARGCPVRSLVKFTQGNLQALVALVVMALSAYAMTRTELFSVAFAPWVGALSVNLTQFGITHQDLASMVGGGTLTYRIMAVVIAAGLLVAAWRWLPLRQNWVGWLGAVLIGAVVGLAFGVSGGAVGQAAQSASEMVNNPQQGLGTQSFTFSAPMGDVVYFLQHPSHWSDITFGVVAVFGLLLGSFISTLMRREFGLVLPTTVREWSRTIIGAVMVGMGSVLAMGCTVGHGLSGISTLALGSFLSLGAIMVGAWLTLRWDYAGARCDTDCGS
ncbi:MAG: YeeE/YedE family protein [Halothiobacillus sp.]